MKYSREQLTGMSDKELNETLAGHVEHQPPKPRARFSSKVAREVENRTGSEEKFIVYVGRMTEQELVAVGFLMESYGYLCSKICEGGYSRVYERCAKIKPRESKELGDTGTYRDALGSVVLGLLVFGAGGFLMYALSYMLVMLLKSTS